MNNYYYICVLVLLAVSGFISLMVKATYKKYLTHSSNASGAYAAQKILDCAGIFDVKINSIPGNLTDNYNPASKTLNLSNDVYSQYNVSAVAVAAHECGHAIQEAEGYALLGVRKTLVPIANFSSNASYICILLGLLLEYSNLVIIGTLLFGAIVIFNLVTLPIEIDASARALRIIDQLDLVDDSELPACKKVLFFAGMTYFMALLSSLLTFIRYASLISRGGRRRD